MNKKPKPSQFSELLCSQLTIHISIKSVRTRTELIWNWIPLAICQIITNRQIPGVKWWKPQKPSRTPAVSSRWLWTPDLKKTIQITQQKFNDFVLTKDLTMSYAPQILVESSSSGELIDKTKHSNPFGFFLANESMYILYGKNSKQCARGL